MLPAVLLLLSDQPGYGYGLVPRLREFRFGNVDRPAVYRTLARLERDGLVESSSPPHHSAGQARRVYHVTPKGRYVLRTWMGVVKEEHDHLGEVLRRYRATGTADAAMAEIEGGWSSTVDFGWSAVSSTAGTHRRLVPIDVDWEFEADDAPECDDTSDPDNRTAEVGTPQRFHLVPDRSVVLIEVRSTVGPLTFGALGVTGWVEGVVRSGSIGTDTQPTAHLEIDMSGLRSGNILHDAELLRRVDARRFPTATVDLVHCESTGPEPRYQLQGEVTFHGVTRKVQGAVTAEVVSEDRLTITGEQDFDIRDFAIPSPTVLMLRIYPDVRVRLHAEAVRKEEP
jgi:DNA-binding PadR family transcriptional regulator